MNEHKQQQRQQIRALRRGLDDARRREQSALAAARVLELPLFLRAKTMLAYSHTGAEADPAAIAAQAALRGVRVAYPVCEGGRLHAYIPKVWRTGSYGIREPQPEESVYIAPEVLDFVIVPGIAFDTRGYRLGQGAGYYDAYLPLATNAFILGFAFDEQLVERVEHEAHDIRMHGIAAPSRLLLIR